MQPVSTRLCFHSNKPFTLFSNNSLSQQPVTATFWSKVLLYSSPAMRYDSWDVILFPRDSLVPLQEFRTACYADQDERVLAPPLK